MVLVPCKGDVKRRIVEWC